MSEPATHYRDPAKSTIGDGELYMPVDTQDKTELIELFETLFAVLPAIEQDRLAAHLIIRRRLGPKISEPASFNARVGQ